MIGCKAIRSDVGCKAPKIPRLPSYRLGVNRINTRTNPVVN